MSDPNMQGSCNCNCGGCKGGVCATGMPGGWCHGSRHHWLVRLIVGIAILCFVFRVGFEAGEFKGEFMKSMYGDRYGQTQMMQRNGMYMMGGQPYSAYDDFGF